MMKSISYRAAVATSDQTVRIETITTSVRDDCELLRVLGCFICGSDLQNIRSGRYVDQVLGHELVAERLTASPHNLVTILPIIPCHNCGMCLIGEFRDCANKKSIGADLPGGFAEYIQTPQWNIVPASELLSEHSTGLIEPLACSIRLFFDLRTRVERHRNILIIGDGPIGILNYRVFSVLGEYRVKLIGKYQQRLAFLQSSGDFILSGEVDSLDFENASAIIVCSKSEAFILQNLNYISPGTQIFLQTRISDESSSRLIDHGLNLTRGFAYRYEDFVLAQEFILSGRITCDDLATKEIAFSFLPAFFSNMPHKADFMKVFVRISNRRVW